MGVIDKRAGGASRGWFAHCPSGPSALLLSLPILLVFAFAQPGWSLQQNDLLSGEGDRFAVAANTQHAAPQTETGQTHGAEGGTTPQQQGAHEPSPAPQPVPQPHAAAPKVQEPAEEGVREPALPSGEDHGKVAEPGHGAAPGVHGPALPEISPIPGVTFVETMIQLMDYELHGRTFGWRPNDIVFGRFTDNVNYYQLGVLEAIRFTTLRLKDSLTRMGDADTYDPDLEQALNLFMNRATLFWFPSAENSYGEALDHLRAFVKKLKSGERSFFYRKDNLILLINAYKDLLGNVNKTLIVSPVSFFKADDYFYYAKGVSHVYYEILRVVRGGFQAPLASTLHAQDIMDEIIHELYKAEQIDPWIILNSDLDSLTANHRANLNAPLSEVVHLLGILGQL